MTQQQIEIDQAFRADAQGRIAFTSDPARVLRNRVLTVIGTLVGERVMRPQYGTPLLDMLFEPEDDITTSLIVTDINKAIAQYEPGVLVQSVEAQPDPDNPGIITLVVSYSSANSPYVLSIPVNTAALFRGGAIQEERSG